MKWPDETHPLATVMRILDVTESAVSNWSRRGMAGLWVEPSGRGRGRERRLSLQMIVRMAIMKCAVDLGVTPHRAALLSDQILVDMEKRSIGTVRLVLYASVGEFRIIDDDLPADRPADAVPLADFTIHVTAIISRVKYLLETGVNASLSLPGTSVPSPRKKRRSAAS